MRKTIYAQKRESMLKYKQIQYLLIVDNVRLIRVQLPGNTRLSVLNYALYITKIMLLQSTDSKILLPETWENDQW